MPQIAATISFLSLLSLPGDIRSRIPDLKWLSFCIRQFQDTKATYKRAPTDDRPGEAELSVNSQFTGSSCKSEDMEDDTFVISPCGDELQESQIPLPHEDPTRDNGQTPAPLPLTHGTLERAVSTTPKMPTSTLSTGSCPPITLLEVERRLSPMERLKSMTTATSLNLNADPMGQFNIEDKHKLRQLTNFLHSHSPELFRGQQLPEIILSLVSVKNSSDLSSTGEPFICVKGLSSNSEITRFHTVMSQKTVRAYYAPLKLCYDRSGVSFASSVLLTEKGDSPRISVVGGLVEIDDRCYMLTTNHGAKSTSTQSEENASSVDTLVDDDFDDDVESALILQDEENPLKRLDLKLESSHGSFPETVCIDDPVYDGTFSEDTDWQLVPLHESHCLLNYRSVSTNLLREQQVFSGYTKEHQPGPGISPAFIIAGMSVLIQGSLLGSPSYLMSRGKLQEVWAIQLKSGLNLQKGDSGSWVIDPSKQVLGFITAISGGHAYMKSFQQIIEEIEEQLRPQSAVRLLHPFDILLKLAQVHATSNKHLATSYSVEAMSDQVIHPTLNRFSNSLEQLADHGYTLNDDENDCLDQLYSEYRSGRRHASLTQTPWKRSFRFRVSLSLFLFLPFSIPISLFIGSIQVTRRLHWEMRLVPLRYICRWIMDAVVMRSLETNNSGLSWTHRVIALIAVYLVGVTAAILAALHLFYAMAPLDQSAESQVVVAFVVRYGSLTYLVSILTLLYPWMIKPFSRLTRWVRILLTSVLSFVIMPVLGGWIESAPVLQFAIQNLGADVSWPVNRAVIAIGSALAIDIVTIKLLFHFMWNIVGSTESNEEDNHEHSRLTFPPQIDPLCYYLSDAYEKPRLVAVRCGCYSLVGFIYAQLTETVLTAQRIPFLNPKTAGLKVFYTSSSSFVCNNYTEDARSIMSYIVLSFTTSSPQVSPMSLH
ncbi:hypothetical protein HD806DRAFT_526504 [Xylariaceae sp. AK1471]|nr:hypothetical protein HD806DRAFT_526504 [Xylariaceae sp. AK1471]